MTALPDPQPFALAGMVAVLRATRAQLDAAAETVDACLSLIDPQTGEPGEDATGTVECTHPRDKVRDESAFGAPLFRCTTCGAELRENPND